MRAAIELAVILAVLMAALACAVTPEKMRACMTACSPGIVAAVESELTGEACRCQHPAGACTVDRLLVTPVPPARRAAEKGGQP